MSHGQKGGDGGRGRTQGETGARARIYVNGWIFHLHLLLPFTLYKRGEAEMSGERRDAIIDKDKEPVGLVLGAICQYTLPLLRVSGI